jgi:hypothetical protein
MTLSQGQPRVSTRKKGSLGVANKLPLGVDLSLGSRQALIQLDGADDLLVHRIGETDSVSIGDRVEAVLAEAAERKGSILDVRHFRPV